MSVTIEVCIDSLDSARAAVAGGANRLEVCANLGAGGGTTPSLGLIRSLRRNFPSIELMVMVRPRPGDFVYTSDELEVMEHDILSFKNEGVAGIVLGVLTSDGLVDVEQTQRLASLCSDIQFTFHRAIDMTRDSLQAVTAISKIPNVTRILTSGLQRTALEGVHIIADMAAVSTCTILPGSGINAATAIPVLRVLWPHGVRELHMSGGEWLESKTELVARREDIDMGGWRIWHTSKSKVRAVRDAVDALASEFGSS